MDAGKGAKRERRKDGADAQPEVKSRFKLEAYSAKKLV